MDLHERVGKHEAEEEPDLNPHDVESNLLLNKEICLVEIKRVSLFAPKMIIF